jgi:rhodanese-related sulfurtransferase
MVPAERRRAPRVSLNVPVMLRADSQAIECVAENISRTGIFIRTPSSIPPGARVSLRCKLPFGVMAVDAIVVHCRSGGDASTAGLGLQFQGQTAIADAYLSVLCGAGAEAF